MAISAKLKKFNQQMRHRRLIFGLILAIILALLSTAASLIIYKVGGFYRYDLSRPGYEKERSEVASAESTITYDTTSALTKENIKTAVDALDAHLKIINDSNSFKDDSLSDINLQITN